jgi:hypothetical protein
MKLRNFTIQLSFILQADRINRTPPKPFDFIGAELINGVIMNKQSEQNDLKERFMVEPIDPLVSEDKVPSYNAVEEIIKEIDHTIIIYRVYYLLGVSIYRFQLIKKDEMCIIEVPRALLESLGTDGTSGALQLSEIINTKIEDAECWSKLRT